MKHKKLTKQLRDLTGHLILSNKEERCMYDELTKLLRRTSITGDDEYALKNDFSFERSDLFFDEAISDKRRDELDKLAAMKRELKEDPEFRVYVREVPIRDPLLHASVPDWAAGAKVSHTIGPFNNKDGRKFWYDFFPVVKLIALYIQGESEPALLFNASASIHGLNTVGSLSIALNKKYQLDKGSIWINSRYLAPNSPASSYTGLSISSGTVSLSSNPVDQDGKLTVNATSKISVDLNIAQTEASDTDKKSPYGVDARNLGLSLPDSLSFIFSSQGRTIKKLGDAKWKLYGKSLKFAWEKDSQTTYDPLLQRIIFPFAASDPDLHIRHNKSPFNTLSHTAGIKRSAWTLPVTLIDIAMPIETDDSGSMMVQTDKGLVNQWQGLDGGGINLANPVIFVSPGQILVADITNGNPHAKQSLRLWQDSENKFGTKVKLSFANPALFVYASNANGNELFMTTTNADFQIDRPVKVDGQPPAIRSVNSILLVAVSSATRLIYLFDDNLIQDAAQLSKQDPIVREPMAFALSNALFRVSKVNGCLLFGELNDDYNKVKSGILFITFGLHAYLPTLPDPYAADLGVLRCQIRGRGHVSRSNISSWLICMVQWKPPGNIDEVDDVSVSFHFAPLTNRFGGVSYKADYGTTSTGYDNCRYAGDQVYATYTVRLAQQTESPVATLTNKKVSAAIAAHNSYAGRIDDEKLAASSTSSTGKRDKKPLPDYERAWDKIAQRLQRNVFSLLDVSTNADLYGVSFNPWPRRGGVATTSVQSINQNSFPFQVKGMSVISRGANVKAFTVPQISWEPLINMTPPAVAGDPSEPFNYYPDDGGAMQILNNSNDTVVLAPLPVTNHLINNFRDDTPEFTAYAFMTLPFGLKALAVLQNEYSYTDKSTGGNFTRRGSEVLKNAEEFDGNIRGGLQLQLNAGEAVIKEVSDTFAGSTVQLNNVLDFTGTSNGASTLGRSVTEIFNNDFFPESLQLIQEKGVPLTRIDLSGYGASSFSNWLDPNASFSQTSQVKFDVMVGRCAHEIIQVRSMMYPWGIKVVRTVNIFRVSSGYVYRLDSGWRAESSGEYDFRYSVNESPVSKIEKDSPYTIHPGLIKGLYNVTNIIETDDIATVEGQMVSAKSLDDVGMYIDNPAADDILDFKLQPVFFDADVEIDDVISGFKLKKVGAKDKNLVPAKKIVGYVQLAPKGIPLTERELATLVVNQMGAIGGPIDCEVDLAASGQKMRLNRFDFNNSFGSDGTEIIFAVAGRGNVLLPQDGSWSMVKHERDTGEVSPVPGNLGVPVIREGAVSKTNGGQELDKDISDVLLRIANPSELLRAPGVDTLNYGFVQNIDTQKVLFLTPAFEPGKKKLFSKTPPLFVDAFRIVNSKSIFPNIGNAEDNLGDVISLGSTAGAFLKGGLEDIGSDVWELMDVTGAAQNAKELGYKLLSQVTDFTLPSTEFELIDVGDGNFRIYIDYQQVDDDDNVTATGKLDYNIDSLANDVAENWKSKMENIALVIDLAGIKRLLTINGKWDSKKGAEGSYPQPELKFSEELQPIIDILEILQQIQTGAYAEAVGNGIDLAMSNKAGSWEYKFEASKEIPVLRFPVPNALYNDPNTPLKLEAGLTVGAYFNAALMVTSSANDLLPSAGGILGFYGRLSVMCVSLSAVTVYAIGQVNLDIAADTKTGPSLRMKFGFGAQIVVGLPVAGNVSVLYMVGIEIYAAEEEITVSAFMLFEGHAEILGGLIAITIRIEAMGTISRKEIATDEYRTDLVAQVTFGLDISLFLIININFETSWSEQRQLA